MSGPEVSEPEAGGPTAGTGRRPRLPVRLFARGSWPETRRITTILHKETVGGAVLLFAAAVVLIWANSPWSGGYVSLWESAVSFDAGPIALHLDLRGVINDLAMVLFFFVAGLEIKREITLGELRDPRQAALPIIAAFGGMVVPALLFTMLNLGSDVPAVGVCRWPPTSRSSWGWSPSSGPGRRVG